jgi:subtilase family serine protease
VARPIKSLEANAVQRSYRSIPLTAACVAALLMPSAAIEANAQQVLLGHVPHAVASSHALSKLEDTTRLNIAIGLPLRNQNELDALLLQLSDPASPEFGRYLSAEQFAVQFGPTEQEYQALIHFAHENGLVVTGTHSNRVLLDVSGEVSEIEKALHVKMMVYDHPVRGRFYAPDREPSIDFDVKVLDISGLDDFALPQPMGLNRMPLEANHPYVTGSGPDGYFIGKDFRAAYAPGVSLTGSGQVVGLLEFDGFYAGDVQKNAAQAGVPVVPTQTVLLDGFNGSPGGDNIEVILDIMMASYVAPGLSKVIVYEGSTPNDILNRMATDNLAQQLSSSWGFGINATTEQIFKQYIAQGQSMLQASGDSGAYLNGVMTPSDDPNLTVAGGTSLTTAGSGGPWLSETVWSGSGGGVSTVYPIPSYQQGLSMAANRGSTKMRNIPDVAMIADIQMYLIQSNGQAVVVGGTSAAAPLWSGFVALANQQAAANGKPRVGFLNPLLYGIGKSSDYVVDLNDIRSGSNNGFSAVSGYDLTTGWGSPAGQHLINDLTGTSGQPSFLLSSSASALSITRASTGVATITVTAENGSSSSVVLGVSGLPSGVTAAFSPATTTKNSTVTFTVNSSAAGGFYPLTITGASGSLSSTTTIALTVVVPSFSLSSSPSILTVARTGSGSSSISVAGQNGFRSSVNLSVSGLPSGVTVIFSPTATINTSKVTFTVNSSAPGGTYPLSIKGVSAGLSNTTTIGLTVVVPSFSLSSSPSSLTIARTSNGSSTISVAGLNGFSGSVSFAVSGLPTGLTPVFSPSSTTAKTSLTFNASGTVTPETYTAIVNGASGALTSATTIGLTITAPNFTLSLLPASLGLPRGATASGTVTVTPQNRFNSSVILSASGLPSGVTASFAALNTAGTSLVTFTANSTATAGSFPISVKGVSGALTSGASFTLTVLAPSAGTSLVNLSPAYNINAMVTDGLPFAGGGLDGGLNGSRTAYSANLIGVQQTIGGALFYFGPANGPDAVSAKTVSLVPGQFSSINLLATGVNGSQISQTFKVTYTDGTVSTYTQSLSDWFTPQNFTGETKAMTMAYRVNGQGQRDNQTFYLYEYKLALIANKTAASIMLPNNRNVVVLAATLSSATASIR